MPNRRQFLALAAGAILLPVPASATPSNHITVWKTASCGCCQGWIDHIKEAGFKVDVIDMARLDFIKSQYKIPLRLQSCHTSMIDDYILEGHVPAADIRRLIKERPKATGLAVAGDPAGAPGTGGVGPYTVTLFGPSGETVFSRY